MQSMRVTGTISAALALVAVVAIAALPAGAQIHAVTGPVAGSAVVTGGAATTLAFGTGSSFTGNFDDTTGSLTGTNTFLGGTVHTTGAPFGDTDLAYSFVTGAAIQNGMITPEGSVVFDDVVTIVFESIGTVTVEPLPDTCQFGPIDTHFTGTYDPLTGVMEVTGDPVGMPPLDDSACGQYTQAFDSWAGNASVTMQATYQLPEFSPNPTTTTTSSSTTTSLWVSPVQAFIDSNLIVSVGCDVTVPIEFGEGGQYTLDAISADGQVIESIDIIRSTSGPFEVHMSFDQATVTHIGDTVNFVLRDSRGVQVANAVASVRAPEACLATLQPDDATDGSDRSNSGANGANGSVAPASAATPVAGHPVYTG